MRAVDAGAGVPELRAEPPQVVAASARQMVEARHVDMLATDPAIVLRGSPNERREVAGHVEPNLLAQVATDDVRPVAEPVGVPLRLRVEQNAGRVDAARAEDDDLPADLLLGAGAPIEVLHAGCKTRVTGENPCDDGVRANLELSGLHRERQQVIGRTEEGSRVASRAAVATVVTRGKSAGRTRHVGAAAGHYGDAELRHAALQQALATSRPRRRLEKLAPGKGVRVVSAATDADELLDLIVVGRDIGVRDRPRDLPAVALGRLEIHLRVAQAHATPHVRLAAVSPDPGEREWPSGGREVRLFLGVEEEGLGAARRAPRVPAPATDGRASSTSRGRTSRPRRAAARRFPAASGSRPPCRPKRRCR